MPKIKSKAIEENKKTKVKEVKNEEGEEKTLDPDLILGDEVVGVEEEEDMDELMDDEDSVLDDEIDPYGDKFEE